MEFFAFDQRYVERLCAGDRETESHFVSYFSELVRMKLRARRLDQDAIEDMRQETFVRVLATLRKDDGLQHPERLGAFVNSVCNNVMMEHIRSASRHPQLPDSAAELPDKNLDLDGILISDQAKQVVQQVLTKLSQKDREVIRAVLLEEDSKDQVCQRLGVDRDYLRVLLHRAKQSFKAHYKEAVSSSA